MSRAVKCDQCGKTTSGTQARVEITWDRFPQPFELDFCSMLCVRSYINSRIESYPDYFEAEQEGITVRELEARRAG